MKKNPIDALGSALEIIKPNVEWENSHPYLKKLHAMSSKKKGAITEIIIDMLWGSEIVKKRAGSENDRIINGFLVEIKFSTKWESKSTFKFQQFRPEQNPDYYLCFGVYPNGDWYFYTFPSKELYTYLGVQHGGKKATTSNTYWFDLDPTNPPSWVKDVFGQDGTQETALKTFGINVNVIDTTVPSDTLLA